jgi:phenylalanyl-tRNA synthetase alpha chain
VTDELTAIFSDMGFSIAEGPDIETDYYNFTALNFPEGHPAREMHDTFFFNESEDGERKLLRTHTSPVQIRTMEEQKPPIRIIIPGKTYRQDSDATHSPMFHQVEGLVIDRSANVANLKWVLTEFCKAFFEVEHRSPCASVRPSSPSPSRRWKSISSATAPSRARCVSAKGSDWMEILGCGMVHPNVLRYGGLDPDEYQGFAWGIGIDRLAMLKYGMPDLRAFSTPMCAGCPITASARSTCRPVRRPARSANSTCPTPMTASSTCRKTRRSARPSPPMPALMIRSSRST